MEDSPPSERAAPPLASLLVVNNHGIASLLAHTRHLAKLTQQMVSILPERFRHTCRVANVTDTTLVLEADSPAWASTLRYHCPTIVEQLQRCGYPNLELRETKILIAQPPPPPEPPPRRATISSESLEFLRQTARDCSDPDLRAAWERFIRNREREGER